MKLIIRILEPCIKDTHNQAWGQVLWYLYLSTLSTASKVLVLILKSICINTHVLVLVPKS